VEYLPTFARTKSPNFVGKYTSTMEDMVDISESPHCFPMVFLCFSYRCHGATMFSKQLPPNARGTRALPPFGSLCGRGATTWARDGFVGDIFLGEIPGKSGEDFGESRKLDDSEKTLGNIGNIQFHESFFMLTG
jgi:hypothetical protein